MKNNLLLTRVMLVLIILSGALTAKGQNLEWFEILDGNGFDLIEDVAADGNGYVYACGKMTGTITLPDTTLKTGGKSDLLIMKYDTAGNRIWIKRDGGPGNDYAVEMDIDAAGNIYVGGRFEDTTYFGGELFVSLTPNNTDIFVMKLTPDGDVVWTKQFSGHKDDRLRGLVVDEVGNTYFTGRYRAKCTFGPFVLKAIDGKYDIQVVKLDPNGNVVWAHDLGGPKLDFGEAINRTPDGGIYVTGSFFQWCAFGDSLAGTDTIIDSNGDEEGFLAKYDEDGNFIWARTLGGRERDYGEDINYDEFNNVLVSGGFSDTIQFGDITLNGNATLDIFVSKWTPDGRPLWATYAGSERLDVAWGSDYDGKGNTYITGLFKDTMTWGPFFLPAQTFDFSMHVAKIGPGGDLIWVRKMGDIDSYDEGRGVACDANGVPYVGGYAQDTAYYDTFYLEVQGQQDIIFSRVSPGVDSCGIGYIDPYISSCTDSTYDLQVTLHYYNPPSTGELVVDGDTFAITGSPQVIYYPGLPLDTARTEYDINAYFTDRPTCDFTFYKAYRALDSCTDCSIQNITVDSIGDCDPFTNNYDVTITIDYLLPPDTGNINVNGQLFPMTSSPQTVTLTDLPSDGNTVSVDAFFVDDYLCQYYDDSLFTAPTPCDTCIILDITMDTVGFCDPVTGLYDAVLTIDYINPTAGDTLDINGQLFAIETAPQTITLTGLTPDGLPVNVSATSMMFPGCTYSEDTLFYAPVTCVCSIDTIIVDSVGDCDPATNTYEATLTVEYTAPPAGDSLNVNGQLFPVVGVSETVTLTGLPSNGSSVAIEALFGSTSCISILDSAFMAPTACDTCVLVNVTLDSLGACNTVTDEYSAFLTVEYLNPPPEDTADGIDTISINGQHFLVTGSPQTVELTGLISDGMPVDVTAFFLMDTTCRFEADTMWYAPATCVCVVSGITLDNVGVCDPTTNTYDATVTVDYIAAPPGDSLTVNGQLFAQTMSPQTVVLTGLPSDGLPVNVTANFASDPLCNLTIDTMFYAPVACDTCLITSITMDSLGDCNTVTGLYDAFITVTYYNEMVGDTLDINGVLHEATGSPQTIVLSDLTSNGLPVAVAASFLLDASCNYSDDTLFISPETCICAINSITVDSIGDCDPITNSYDATLIVDYTAPPVGDSLHVNGFIFEATGSPQTVVLAGLASDGMPVSVTANFPMDTLCTLTEDTLFYAPAACDTCLITSVVVDSVGDCDSLTDTYSATLTLTYYNEMVGDTLNVNGQLFEATGSPQQIVLTGLLSDGLDVDVNASFLLDAGCSYSATGLFTAPIACVCKITAIAVDSVGDCNPVTNTYEAQLSISYEAPVGDTLDVNGQLFFLSGSPQTVVLSGLVSDGGPVSVTALFQDDSACTLTEDTLFYAPMACDTCAITSIVVDTVTACSPATGLYDATVIVTYGNEMVGDTLVVNGVQVPATGSPQTVVLSGLVADGMDVDVNASFLLDPSCSMMVSSLFAAPVDCVCSIDFVTVDTVGECDPLTNTYFATLTIGYTNAPAGSSLEVNGQTFALTASPQSISLLGLNSDGLGVDVNVSFTGDTLCEYSGSGLFTAPAACDFCDITDISLSATHPCDPYTSTYSIDILVTYLNEPAGGFINVNGIDHPVTGSPQLVSMTGLPLDGTDVSVTAFFTDDSACAYTEPVVTTSESSCDICLVPTNLYTELDTTDFRKVRLIFDPVPNAFEYLLQGGKVGTGGYAQVSSADNIKQIGVLLPGRTYRWQARAHCPADTSDWSTLDTFTALSPRPGLFDTEEFAKLYPVPANDWTWLSVTSEKDRDVEIRIFNSTGAVVRREIMFLAKGATLTSIDLSTFAAGQYFVELRDEKDSRTLPLLIER